MTIGTIEVSPENPTTNSQVTITPTIRNAESATDSAQITEVSVNGPSTLESTDNIGRIGPGNSVTVPFSTAFETAGQHRLTVYVRGTDADGDSFVIQKPVYVTVKQRSTDVGVTAAAKSVNGSPGISATVTQYGSVEIDSGQVQVIADDRVITRAPISNIAGGDAQTVTFDGSNIPPGTLTIRAQYTVDGEYQPRTTNTTLQYAPQNAADMALTGIETMQRGTTYTISGDVSNLGGADANAVLVDVAANESLSSNGGYFVGTVERSEFATFDLTVTATTPVSAIPVRVNYSVNGEQFSQTTTVDVSDSAGAAGPNAGRSNPQSPPRNQSSGSGGLPLLEIGVGVGVLIVAAIGIYRWRNQ
ncbi:hypothetical protein LPA44_17230 [Halobacterium sp. KA-4]|uniref:CARDB domain-containing protein n=1 Tax=Halobacterium sp. KA-4 TaxID=2896367 RepID=UPI001E2970E8|nr:CARDB domain-containing protein [Halobacterium sp. KA-4]MCD2201607.1 hypothetical protein [Halobacterium sp. KA-4]